VAERAYHLDMSRSWLRSAAFAAAVLVLAGGCVASEASKAPLLTGAPPTERIPIIIDADLDLSDLSAIAVLLRDPGVDVRAITIAGTGIVHCRAGRLLTRYLIDQFGVGDTPFGCGRETGGVGAHPFPDEWRAAADAGFGLAIAPSVESGVPRDAVDVMTRAVADSPSAPTVVTLGPLTNLQDTFAADPTIADRVAAVHAMLGTIKAPGNVAVDGSSPRDPLEWNAFADPAAVRAVFDTDVPIGLVPLDATDDVPVPADYLQRLAADHVAAGADLTYELLVRNPNRLRADEGQQLWDELAALTLTNQDLVTWEDAMVTVGADGRLALDDAGRTVRYASAADRPAVEVALLAALRLGGPPATPLALAGSLVATFDGTTCSLAGESDGPGVHDLVYHGIRGTPSGIGIIGASPPHTLDEALTSLPTLDRSKPPPDWLISAAQADDASGSGDPVRVTADLAEGPYAPVCLKGVWPNFTVVPGLPFTVGAGSIGS
jgi:inosine-uridine nucleoside N-ribohydrolase